MSDMARYVVGMLLLSAMTASLIGCGTSEDGSPQVSGPTPATATATDPMATPSVDGRFAVGGEGRLLALRCWGSGSPTVVYGGGSSGIREWSGSAITRGLVSRARVCLYDRAGTGLSDPAQNRKRLLDDVVRDLHDLLTAAKVTPPYILIGQSGGGFNAYHYAGR
jgi:pimeloyl-ACP methyl ester carboxylesterase